MPKEDNLMLKNILIVSNLIIWNFLILPMLSYNKQVLCSDEVVKEEERDTEVPTKLTKV